MTYNDQLIVLNSSANETLDNSAYDENRRGLFFKNYLKNRCISMPSEKQVLYKCNALNNILWTMKIFYTFN